jgi:N-acetylmuramoyl-L-alanine amidase
MLRCDLFPTLPRGATKYIAVRDTLTPADPDFDAYVIDTIHCKQGRLGLGYHFLILVNGDIQLGRKIDTCGSHSRNLDEISVAIGLVGGTDDAGERAFTRTPDQQDALGDLVGFLKERWPEAEIDDKPHR